MNYIAIVANSLAPFAYESALILGLPQGYRYRARFFTQWIDQRVLADLTGLEGKSGYYALRDWESGNIIPLRKITIIRSDHVGPIVYFQYEIGEYFDYSHDEKMIIKQLETFNNDFAAHFRDSKWKNTPNHTMVPLVFMQDNLPQIADFSNREGDKQRADYQKWMSTVNSLARLTVFKGMSFLHLSLRDSITRSPLALRDGAYYLRKNRDYVLNIFHILIESFTSETKNEEARGPDTRYMEDGPYYVKALSSNRSIDIAPTERNFSGRYDMIALGVSPNSNPRKADKLLLEFSVPAEVRRAFYPAFEIFIRYEANWATVLTKGAVMAMSLLIFAFVAYYDIFKSFLGSALHEFVKDLSLIVFTFQFVDLLAYLRSWSSRH